MEGREKGWDRGVVQYDGRLEVRRGELFVPPLAVRLSMAG